MERISTLMDGEMDDHAAATLIKRLREDEPLRAHWDTFHLIGDVMRDGQPLASDRFARQMHERLAMEPTVLVPRTRLLAGMAKRVALPFAASAAAVAMVGWLVLNTGIPGGARTEVATGPSNSGPPATPSTLPVHIRDMLDLHQVSSSAASSGFAPSILRTVSSQNSDRQ